jgi:hypothetical protein
VEEVFTAEDVAEEADRKGEGADRDGEHLDEADARNTSERMG